MTKKRMRRGFQLDLGRQLERPDFLIDWLPRYAEWGYDEVCLYLEDAFDFPSVPGIGRHLSWTPAQFAKVTAEATRNGIEVIPFIEYLGHVSYLLKKKEFEHLSELPDAFGNPAWGAQLCPLNEGTLELARKLFKDIRPYCTSGLLYLGLDEAFDLGKCPRCREEISRIGIGAHFAKYVSALRDICHDLGLKMGLAGDMLYYMPEALPLLPKDVVVFDWFYYPFKSLPRVEKFNFADVDLLGDSKKAGLVSYGCATNGEFANELMPPFLDRLRLVKDWWRYCHERDADGLLITSWAPQRASAELNCLVDAAAATLWLDDPNASPEQMLERGFHRVFPEAGEAAVRIAAASQKYQFTGWYRTQTYKTWSGLAVFESQALMEEEKKYFDALIEQSSQVKAPAILHDSLLMRRYATLREKFIGDGACVIAAVRKAVSEERLSDAQKVLEEFSAAVDEMEQEARAVQPVTKRLWERTRYEEEPNPNSAMLDNDIQRVEELRRFLQAAAGDPRNIFEANPILGRWQMLFWVRNFAPAVQGAAVEQCQVDGSWKELHSLYSMEFIAESGVSKADYRRRHSVPVDWDGRGECRLRLGVRGVGQLEIFGLVLTDGVRVLVPQGLFEPAGELQRLELLTQDNVPGALLGSPAPKQGWISIDWADTQASVELNFLLE